MNELIAMEQMYPLIKQMLEQNGKVTITVVGVSMQPMLYNRRDKVILVKQENKLKKYDLPLFIMDDGSFVLHRVIKINEDGTYNCQGDNRWESETKIRDEQIVGVVKSFIRNGKVVSVDSSLGYWLYTRTWKFFHNFKWMYNLPKRIKLTINNKYKHLKVINKLKKKLKVDEKLDIKYRPVSLKDMSKFYRLYSEFVEEENAQYHNALSNGEWINTENAKRYYDKLKKEHFFWVAVKRNEIIGFCTGATYDIQWNNCRIGEIINIYVKPEYRNCCIGAKLIEIFKGYCKSYNCNKLSVTIMSENISAERFYNRHGFKIFKKTLLGSFD